MDNDDPTGTSALLGTEATTDGDSSENSRRPSSDETLIFDTKATKCSEDLAATWGGRQTRSESGRRRRARSWSQSPPDDLSSEIRILRERLVRTQTRVRPGAVRLLSRRQRLTLVSLALVDFMSFCSMSVMAPFFPREAELKGLSDTTCGLVFSFYAIVMFLTSPIFGKFMPAVGPKFMFTSGMFVAGACNIIFGTLSLVEDSMTFTVLCFVVRGLEALGASAYSTASYVFVVNAFPEAIGSVLGILETFVGLGMSVGPAIGGVLYSIGGFGLPFYTLGVVMVFTVPINHFLLVDCEDFISGSKSASILRLFKIPTIIITGLVIVVVSNTWAFLDPTLEPHLRQFNLSTQNIGLIFLLFSSLYGIFSPIWGWVADRVHNHWCMMVWGLFLSTLGLLLLGPCPFLPFLTSDLWLDLVALSILGVSVALTLLPTFQGVLTSSIYEGGCPEALATYSAVAGVWSCCYSLGEVLGPALGGVLAQHYGFPLCATLCAAACFTMAVVTLTFFAMQESSKLRSAPESITESIPYTDSTWNSSHVCRSRSAPARQGRETSPLLTPCSCRTTYGSQATSSKNTCFVHHKGQKSGSLSVADIATYFLKFDFVTNTFTRIRKFYEKDDNVNSEPELYQNYISNEVSNDNRLLESIDEVSLNNNNNEEKMDEKIKTGCNKYCEFLENAIFGSPDEKENLENLVVKKDSRGLVTKLNTSADKQAPDEILRHNLEKILFYEQSPPCQYQDGCRDDVTYVRGTIALSSTGACEV